MKVLLVNGSPHQNGCTYTALAEVAGALHSEGIGTDFYWIGNKPIGGCIGCFQCAKKQKYVFDDKVNGIIENLDSAKVEPADDEFEQLESSLNGLKVYGHRGLGGF